MPALAVWGSEDKTVGPERCEDWTGRTNVLRLFNIRTMILIEQRIQPPIALRLNDWSPSLKEETGETSGGGIAASNNAFVLTLLGYDNVAVYDASMSEWAADPSLPMQTG